MPAVEKYMSKNEDHISSLIIFNLKVIHFLWVPLLKYPSRLFFGSIYYTMILYYNADGGLAFKKLHNIIIGNISK